MTDSDADEMLDLIVKVPKSRVPDFYAMHGKWLQAATQGDADVATTPAGRVPWNPTTDTQLASAAWKGFPERAKAVFGTLIDNPGKAYTGLELATLHDIPNGAHGLAGVLAHPGRQLKKLNREVHFHVVKDDDGTSRYSMAPDLAALFNDARSQTAGN